MIFFPGWHQPSDARHFPRVFISVNRLVNRRSDFAVNDWILDSGAFTALDNHGAHQLTTEEYAAQINRWRHCGYLIAAVTQDFMCEPFMLRKMAQRDGPLASTQVTRSRQVLIEIGSYLKIENVGPALLIAEKLAERSPDVFQTETWEEDVFPVLTEAQAQNQIAKHQALTIERYADLFPRCPGTYVMPVLQGWTAADYVSHVRQYGKLLPFRAWVGVGSVCKRQSHPAVIEHILDTILRERPDLRLHGFGVKLTALRRPGIRRRLYSADSMASSFAARKARRAGDLTRDANNWRESAAYAERIERSADPVSDLCFLN